MYKTDISVKIASAKFKNPVMPASGAYDYFMNNANVFPMSELGAIMIKSVHRLERPGNPPRRITEVTGGMLNSVGLPSIGIENFLKYELTRYENMGTEVVLSIAGSEQKHYREVLEMLNDNPIVSAVELNFSCPNVGTGLAFSSDPKVLADTLREARPATKLPLFVKLAPNVTDIKPIAKAAEDEGADAITVSNTWKAMKIDINTKKPVLGNTAGGMSGPAIKPQNMLLVWNAYDTVKIPIIASGGISSWQDAIEYFMAGASMVQIGSQNFVNPMCMVEVIAGIDDYLAANGHSGLSDIRGISHRG
ncbi:MAG: dihydroorotate dehydrogenase [Firmicutes bacterium]|nr:dihydroorotate dehydrogenase [Bacillota bacterium]